MSRLSLIAVTALVAGLLAGCEAPPPESKQNGFRGTSMGTVTNPRTQAAKVEANQPPEVQPAADTSGPKVRDLPDAYKNVKVLGDLSEGEFLRVMTSITEWVAPAREDGSWGCAYCHNLENMADDSKYQHKVARRMLQMNAHINKTWTTHVGATGVTCYTCHRGQPVPANIWFMDPGPTTADAGLLGNRNGQNFPAPAVGFATLPYDPFTELLNHVERIRVIGTNPLPTPASTATIQTTEKTYGLMMHMSTSLGVNCTFCHNSRSFGSWETSPPQRVTAWHGIRLVKDLNQTFLEPLQPVYPASQLGPTGDAPKAYCSTCHAGVNKPLYGAPMAQEYPELLKAR